ncbi:hypothetical protein ACSW8S_17335 (plasmid) [Clostridium perfringens]
MNKAEKEKVLWEALKKWGCKGVRADVKIYLNCVAKRDWEPMKKTKLYTKYGCQYCRMLELYNKLTKDN